MTAERSPLAAEIRATIAVAAPLAVANLAQMAIALTNTLMVGHLGAVPLAAAGLGGALYFMLVMLCQGVLTAVAPLAAHAIGADDHPTAGRVASAGLVVAAVLAMPVVAMLTALPWLLALLGYDPALAAEIERFLRMIRWGAPAFLGASVLRFLLVAMFRTRIVMIVPLLALAGSLARKKIVPASAGTFPVSGVTFVLLLVGTVILVGALTFLPALTLGPVVEHFLMLKGNLF